MFCATAVIGFLLLVVLAALIEMRMTKEAVGATINDSLEKLIFHSEDGSSKPPVCIVCDRLLKPSQVVTITPKLLEKNSKLLHAKEFAQVENEDLIASYDFQGPGREPWMKNILLSPRASFSQRRGKSARCGYSCCSECQTSLKKNHMPVKAIANKHVHGDLPPVLLELNSVELALITPVSKYGYVHTWTGGKQKNLKGVLSYFCVSEEKIAWAVLQLEKLGLNGHVVVLMTGKMTPAQKKKVKEKTEI